MGPLDNIEVDPRLEYCSQGKNLMSVTKTITVTMTPTLLKEVEQLAKEEERTVSELVREALRRYQRQQHWGKLRSYGRDKALELGIKKRNVVPLIREFRRQQRGGKPRGKPRK